jgi:hypothetical protein
MQSRYEEAILDVKNPFNPLAQFGLLKPDPTHTVLYEWEVSREQWLEATEPLKQIYIKDFLWYFLLIFFFYLGVPILFGIIDGNFFDNKYFFQNYKNVYFIFTLIFVPILTFIVFKTLTSFKSVREPERRVFFLTNMGVFNGRVYESRLKEYRINEQEQKFSLLLEQCNMGDLTSGDIFLSGIAGKTYTFWNDFLYNEEDKTRIFAIIAMWEQYELVKAENNSHQKLLHDYLNSRSSDEIERITNEMEKPLYVRNSSHRQARLKEMIDRMSGVKRD